MRNKLLRPCIYLKHGQAVCGLGEEATKAFVVPDPVELGRLYGNQGADEVLVFDLSETDEEHDAAIGKIREIAENAEVPVIGAGHIRRMEDVKKLLYAGCKRAVLNFSKPGNIELLEEVSKRFGKDKIAAAVSEPEQVKRNLEPLKCYADMILSLTNDWQSFREDWEGALLVTVLPKEREAVLEVLQQTGVTAVTGAYVSDPKTDRMKLKKFCRKAGIPVNTWESRIAWKDFKKNSDGMVPVIVQDYKTSEVLMLAYMNQESFETTLETGRMTYWSRSRNELWMKGLTSGHFQYVKSLTLDCDRDTILAKVSQVGAACHTGSRTCFFQELVKKEYEDTNPLKVFQDVYDVILDRKVHPKEGSYTNYLFDKGIDKILKKVGEECTEIVIAAKNPDKEEIKYEISDFLYHVMVLMAEKDVTWEEITRELARR